MADIINLDLNLNKIIKYLLCKTMKYVYTWNHIDTVAADVTNRLSNFCHHIPICAVHSQIKSKKTASQ